jgi:hypothetical protein
MSRTWLAVCAALGLAACARPIATGLRDAADVRGVPPGLVVVFDDHEGPWGGDRIEVYGDGRVRRFHVRPGFAPAARAPERALVTTEDDASGELGPPDDEGVVTEVALLRLIDLLVEIEAWEQRASESPGRLQAGKARLVIRIDGHTREVWEYVEDVPVQERLLRVRQILAALVAEAEPSPTAAR